MNTTPTIPLTRFSPSDALIAFASRTPGCNGEVIVSAHPEGIQLRAHGCCSIAGPPDDGNPNPNSGTITGLTPAEARELAGLLLDAAGDCEANGYEPTKGQLPPIGPVDQVVHSERGLWP